MSHYYSENQTSELNPQEIEAVVKGNKLKFITGSGVFSKSKVDVGSLTLIENAIIENNWHVLDLGCGYGTIGISLAKINPTIKISMTDINKRAIMLAKKNIKLNKLDKDRFEIYQGNSYEPIIQKNKNNKTEFDTILLNPPQTAGKKLCIQMITDAKKYLKKNGLLQIVARHNKGGEYFMNLMKEIYDNSEFICKNKGFRVYISKN
jgi:16S rRNA (guanine1207-N2)-methyltransferase